MCLNSTRARAKARERDWHAVCEPWVATKWTGWCVLLFLFWPSVSRPFWWPVRPVAVQGLRSSEKPKAGTLRTCGVFGRLDAVQELPSSAPPSPPSGLLSRSPQLDLT